MASRLINRVTIQRPVHTQNEIGGYDTTWNNYVNVWAEIVARKVDQRFFSEQKVNTKSYTVTIRYRDDIDESMRLVFRDRFFRIKSIVNPYEEDVLLELSVEENEPN